MKTYIIKTILFFLFCSILYPVFLFTWGMTPLRKLSSNLNYRRGSYGHMYTRINEVQHVTDVDILFLGSSQSYRGFDPRIFKDNGFSSFNLGSSSQTPLQTELLLKRYLKTVKPRLVIYEVFPGTFCSDGVESMTDLISNIDIGSDVLNMSLQFNHSKIYHTLAFAEMYNFVSVGKKYVEAKKKGQDTYIEGGYVEKKMQFFTPREFQKKDWKFLEEQFCAFERSLKLIREEEIPVLMVLAPMPNCKYESCLNIVQFMSRLEPHGTFLNFNDSFPLDDTLHFYDEVHMNQRGVEIFNLHLIKMIQLSGKDRV